MCVMSMIGEHYSDKWRPLVHNLPNLPQPPIVDVRVLVPEAEFEQLRKDVAEMKALLVRAKKYDEANNEPACAQDEKVALLKAIAKLVGVDLSDVFGT